MDDSHWWESQSYDWGMVSHSLWAFSTPNMLFAFGSFVNNISVHDRPYPSDDDWGKEALTPTDHQSSAVAAFSVNPGGSGGSESWGKETAD